MRLVIDPDLDRLPNARAKEAVRILRYWAGWLPQMDLARPTEQALMDPDYGRSAPSAWSKTTRRTSRRLRNERRRARYKRGAGETGRGRAP
jgi:hypothetical protein